MRTIVYIPSILKSTNTVQLHSLSLWELLCYVIFFSINKTHNNNNSEKSKFKRFSIRKFIEVYTYVWWQRNDWLCVSILKFTEFA